MLPLVGDNKTEMGTASRVLGPFALPWKAERKLSTERKLT